MTPSGMGQYIALYYGLVKELDVWVGRLLEALEESGLADRTLVLFTSDHGELMGNHGTLSKMEMFEESMRVPLIIRCPGHVKAGAVCDAAVSGVDLMPTILDFAEVPIPERVQGTSLRTILAGMDTMGTMEAEQPSDYAFCEMKDQVCIRSKEWKLVLNPSMNSNLAEPALLFHLAEDPMEQKNLLADGCRTEKVVLMARRLRDQLVGMLEEWGYPKTALVPYTDADWKPEGGLAG